MPVNGLLEYLDKQRLGASQELEKYHEFRNAEHLHRFRVHLKKLKAGLQVLESRNGNRDLKKIVAKVKSLFHRAGIVREIELIENWLRRHRMEPILKGMQIHRSAEKAREGLDSHHKKFQRILDEMGGILRQSIEEINERDMRRYWVGLEVKWGLEKQAIPPSTHWHERRKLAKKMLYTLNTFPRKIQPVLLPAGRINALDHLQDTIGQWHDEVLLKQWLIKTRKLNGKSTDELNKAYSLALQKLNESLANRNAEVSLAFSRAKSSKKKILSTQEG